ncbi:hypothetical protein YWH7199_11060 [Fusobacterium nucleatum YWH7199]|uniref:hypothetical protein n=1 Tax=Fusobacterium nucleatum TaxID=851 RepID=UPI00201AD1C2|nr:hypothetical protein [Fusobacterium nucleatum]MCL4581863.1 hypothetical protein [Fusobacterium nucleatum YWH7199]
MLKIIKFFLKLILTIFLIFVLLFVIAMTTYVKEKYYVIQLSVIRITKIRNEYSLDFKSYGDTKKTINLEITSKGKIPESIVIKNINFYHKKVSIYNQAIKAFEINKATAEKKEFKINQPISKLKHTDGYSKDEIIYLYPLDEEIINSFIYFEEKFRREFYIEIIIEDTETGEKYSDFTDYIYMMTVSKGFHFGPIVK